MGTIYTVSPHLLTGGDPNYHETFDVSRSADSDAWPEIRWMRLGATLEDSDSGHCCGRMRLSGTTSKRFVIAMCELADLMDLDERDFTPEQVCLPLEHAPKPYVQRHMDDGRGFFGMEIKYGGIVRLFMRPWRLDEIPEGMDPACAMHGESPVETHLPPDTPYRRTYAYMPKLWRAIRQDNKRLGNTSGQDY